LTKPDGTTTAGKKQLLAELIGNVFDCASIEAKCKRAGVSKATHYKWVQVDPAYITAIHAATSRHIATLRAKAYQTLHTAMNKHGSESAAQTVLKAGGDIGSGTHIAIQNTNTTEALPDRIREWRRGRELAGTNDEG
jgi:hypothetical protein